MFKACIASNPILANGHLENCRYDVCANQDNPTNAKAAACGSLEAFATNCLNKGFPSDWRTIAGCRKCTHVVVVLTLFLFVIETLMIKKLEGDA